MTATGSAWFLASLLLSATADGSSMIGQRIDAFVLKDSLGASHSLSDWKDRRAIAVVFIGADCPLARQYGPKLSELAQRYKEKSVQFVAVDSNQQDSLAAIQHYARINKIGFPILKDPANQLADKFGAVRTPEAFLLDAGGTIRYRGPIDDQFGVGYARSAASRHHLEDAINDVLADRPVRTAMVAAIGCRIGRVNRRPSAGNVTYSKQIARIVQARCVECHRPGQIAPFALTSYKDVASWAETMREVIDNQRMPPWYANPQYGHFSNDARMPTEEKRLISEWIKNGCPEGNPAELPPPAIYAEGWRIPKPDLVIKMEKPFTVPATGVVEYKYFIVDPGFKHDVWIRAAEGKPSNRSVVHHMVIFYMPPGQTEPEGADALLKAVASSGPGIPALVTPEGYARRIPAGSKLVFQMHYTPNGTEQVDQSEAGLVFADPATVKKEMQIGAVLNFQFLIPPGESDHRVEGEDKFEQDTLLYALIPHMHLRGKAFRFVAVAPDGRTEILLDVPKYDFNWQNIYQLAKPRLMPKGSSLRCVAHYDNSDRNLVNPDPTKPVHFGEQTWDEMMVGMYYYALAEQHLSLGQTHVEQSRKHPARIDHSQTVERAGHGVLPQRGRSANGDQRVLSGPALPLCRAGSTLSRPEVGAMLFKRLFPLFLFGIGLYCFGAKAWADDSPLTEMDPDVAKEYSGKIVAQFEKENKNLPVKIAADADKAVGLVNADTNEGILLVPLKGFREENEGPKDAEKDHGMGLCYIFMSPSFKPLADGKPADAKRLRMMKFKDSEGNEHETLCLMCSVKHVEGDDWQLHVYSGDNEPLAKSSFEEATDAPKADLALTIKDAKDNKATLVINLFGKYCVKVPISHKAK